LFQVFTLPPQPVPADSYSIIDNIHRWTVPVSYEQITSGYVMGGPTNFPDVSQTKPLIFQIYSVKTSPSSGAQLTSTGYLMSDPIYSLSKTNAPPPAIDDSLIELEPWIKKGVVNAFAIIANKKNYVITQSFKILLQSYYTDAIELFIDENEKTYVNNALSITDGGSLNYKNLYKVNLDLQDIVLVEKKKEKKSSTPKKASRNAISKAIGKLEKNRLKLKHKKKSYVKTI
jgi:hypothetical protein